MEPAYVKCPKCGMDLHRIKGDASNYVYCKNCEKWLSPKELGF